MWVFRGGGGGNRSRFLDFAWNNSRKSGVGGGGVEVGEVGGLGFGLVLGFRFLLELGSEFGSALCFDLFAGDFEGGEEAGRDAVFGGCVGVGVAEFEARGYGAVGGIGDDLFDYGFCSVGSEAGLGEVEGGDLEAVEEESGAFWVDVVGGDAAEDFADGDLDGSAVFGQGEVEGGLAQATGARVADGLAGGVVEVAELFAAEAGAPAAAAFGMDVAALEALGCGLDLIGHVVGPPSPLFVCKIFKTKGLSSYLEAQAGKLREPGWCRALLVVCFYFS